MYNKSQSDVSLNENSTENVFNDKATTAQGPMDDNKKIKLQKECTMETLMNDGDITMTTMIEHEKAKENCKKFLYARAMHSNHMKQYHRQQILEHQKEVDEYRSMVEEGRGLIPLESNLFKHDPVGISHIIHMIDVDIFWPQKTFEAVLAELWRNKDKQVNEQENETKYCKEKALIHEENDTEEVIDLCGESQTTTSDHWKVEQKSEKTMIRGRAKQSLEK